MKTIQLTQGQVALVDDEDFEYLNQFKWYCIKGGNTFYAIKSYCDNGKQTRFSMHRLILNAKGFHEVVDHKDHNGLNNQKSNLRKCTHSENSKNKTSSKNSLSKYLGVSKRIITIKSGKSYHYIYASIASGGKNIHIGMYKTEEDAAKAYDLKAIELHGEFANLNFK